MDTKLGMMLVAMIWIQLFTSTNFDFSAYSSEFKSVLGISQVQLNYLATASDLGKAIGWSSGVALMVMPLWAVMFTAAGMGLVGYVQGCAVLRVSCWGSTTSYRIRARETGCRAYRIFVNLHYGLPVERWPLPGVEFEWMLPREPPCRWQDDCVSVSRCGPDP